MDVAYRLAEFFPVKIIALVMKEIYRCRKVYDGVDHAAKLYPDAFLIMIVIGIVKGNGDDSPGCSRDLSGYLDTYKH
nr:unnamed protein product [Callosobruchus analis]